MTSLIGLAFTPEQFKTLLRMIYLANTMANGQKEEEYLREYDELEQYIFSRAGDAGFPAATWKHKAMGTSHHHPSRIFESDPDLNRLMDTYDALVSIELVAEKLAERDIELKHGPGAKNLMPENEYNDLFDAYVEQYENEFGEFGFTRLVIEKKTAQPAQDETGNKKEHTEIVQTSRKLRHCGTNECVVILPIDR